MSRSVAFAPWPEFQGRVRYWAYSAPEIIADGIVHGVGLLLAVGAGSVLIAFALSGTAANELPALAVYVSTLIVLFGLSLSFNISPVCSARRILARLDQAAIFLFIAGTYTPFLVLMEDTRLAQAMGAFIWVTALAGAALKLFVPRRFGRVAIPLYLAIGWSGVFAFQSLAAILPPASLWLLVAGGVVYSLGLLFHLWTRLRFHNVLWHGFVVLGAALHAGAVLDAMVISRLA